MSKWTPWIDIEVRSDSRSRHYLLQMRRHTLTNKARFRNVPMDKTSASYTFRGRQGEGMAIESAPEVKP